jgi:hypothetical protein
MRKAILSSYHLNPRLITSLLPHHHLTHRINHHHQITSLSTSHHQLFFVSSNPLSDNLKSFSVDVTVYATYFSSFWVHNKDHHLNYYGRNTHRHRYTHTTTYLSCSTIYTTILRHLTHIRSIVLQEGLCGQSPLNRLVSRHFWLNYAPIFPSFFFNLYTRFELTCYTWCPLSKPSLISSPTWSSPTLEGLSYPKVVKHTDTGSLPHLLAPNFLNSFFLIFWGTNQMSYTQRLYTKQCQLWKDEKDLLDTTKLDSTRHELTDNKLTVMILFSLLFSLLIVLIFGGSVYLDDDWIIYPHGEVEYGVCNLLKYERGIGEEIRTMDIRVWSVYPI